MPRASVSMLLYLISVLVRLLPVTAMGCNVLFSGVLFNGNCIPSPTCGELLLIHHWITLFEI